MPGVGQATAHVLLAELPEWGRPTVKRLRSSWAWPLSMPTVASAGGSARPGGDGTSVRSALYMATLVATRHNKRIQDFYQRLLDRGKAEKKALVACMRKLFVILNTMVKNRTPWNPDLHSMSA